MAWADGCSPYRGGESVTGLAIMGIGLYDMDDEDGTADWEYAIPECESGDCGLPMRLSAFCRVFTVLGDVVDGGGADAMYLFSTLPEAGL